MNYLKNKKILAVAGLVIVLFVAGVAVFISKQTNKPVASDSMVAEESLPTLSPEEIGMVVSVRADKKAIMFELKKAQNIKHVDYEIRYTHDVDGERVSEGLLGEMNISDDGITKTDFRPFGTCSSGVCRYDKDVADVKLVLKVEMKDGKIYQVEKPVTL